MAKKKTGTVDLPKGELDPENEKLTISGKTLDEMQAKIQNIEQTLDSFRTSFQNFDTKLKTLIERNRLR